MRAVALSLEEQFVLFVKVVRHLFPRGAAGAQHRRLARAALTLADDERVGTCFSLVVLLSIGSEDPSYFESGMGTIFISFIADTLSRLIPRYT